MVTSVGYGAVGSCHGLRAGVSRPDVVEGVEVSDGEDGTLPVLGLPARAYAEGFYQTGAWVRLASGAVEDLLHRFVPGRAPGLWSRASAIGLAPVIDEERMAWSLDVVPDALVEAFVEPVALLNELDVPPAAMAGFGLGHVGLAAGLERAERELSTRAKDRCLLFAGDSYLDPMAAAWLVRRNRLKTPDRSVGIIPGEAGAALLLENEAALRARRAEVLGYVEAVSAAAPPPAPPTSSRDENGEEDPHRVLPPPPAAPLGRALADAIRAGAPAALSRAVPRGSLRGPERRGLEGPGVRPGPGHPLEARRLRALPHLRRRRVARRDGCGERCDRHRVGTLQLPPGPHPRRARRLDRRRGQGDGDPAEQRDPGGVTVSPPSTSRRAG